MGMKTGTVAHLFWRERILLIKRDRNIRTVDPGCWDSITETIEPGEDFDECIRRGIFEEANFCPVDLRFLGVTRAGHGFYVGFPSDAEILCASLGSEGTDLRCFTLEEVRSLRLGGALRNHLEAYPEAFEKMFRGQCPHIDEMRLQPIVAAVVA
jgi:hypothetical protein